MRISSYFFSGDLIGRLTLKSKKAKNEFNGDERHSKSQSLTMDNLNPRVIEVEYAVRGPIVIRAAEIENALKQVREKEFDRNFVVILFYFLSESIFRKSKVFLLIASSERISATVMPVEIKFL